jgi:hypothetical protein
VQQQQQQQQAQAGTASDGTSDDAAAGNVAGDVVDDVSNDMADDDVVDDVVNDLANDEANDEANAEADRIEHEDAVLCIQSIMAKMYAAGFLQEFLAWQDRTGGRSKYMKLQFKDLLMWAHLYQQQQNTYM